MKNEYFSLIFECFNFYINKNYIYIFIDLKLEEYLSFV